MFDYSLNSCSIKNENARLLPLLSLIIAEFELLDWLDELLLWWWVEPLFGKRILLPRLFITEHIICQNQDSPFVKFWNSLTTTKSKVVFRKNQTRFIYIKCFIYLILLIPLITQYINQSWNTIDFHSMQQCFVTLVNFSLTIKHFKVSNYELKCQVYFQLNYCHITTYTILHILCLSNSKIYLEYIDLRRFFVARLPSSQEQKLHVCLSIGLSD